MPTNLLYQPGHYTGKYNASDLKKVFPKLKDVNDSILTPIMDVLFTNFIQSINSKTRLKTFEHNNNEYDFFDINGKKVEIRGFIGQDICAKDYDDSWYIISSIEFEGNTKKSVMTLVNKFNRFVAGQNLDNLVKKTAEELGKHGKSCDISNEMSAFYFKR